MILNTISKRDFVEFVDALIEKEGNVFGVIKKGKKHYDFSALKSGNELILDYDVTVNPPKKFLNPPIEKLISFSSNADSKSVFDDSKRILVGVHTYDLKAINQMDMVFADGEKDIHYEKRRKNTFIIALEPVKAHKRSFWSSMNAVTVNKGFDLLLTDIGDKYVVETGTKKGEEFLKKYAKVEKASESDLRIRDTKRSNLKNMCERRVNVKPEEISQMLANAEKHPVWEEKAKKCYSCGTCNLVCPTCYCFDVREEFDLTLKQGSRTRFWDGCLLKDFAVVGHGENFRGEKADRFKHRIYRKGHYLYDKYNELFCVGCGRCSQSCLPDIADPVDVLNKIKETL